jgi:flagellar motor switch protein FliM
MRRKDINLTDKEIKVLKRAFKETMNKYREVFERLANT